MVACSNSCRKAREAEAKSHEHSGEHNDREVTERPAFSPDDSFGGIPQTMPVMR